MDYREIGKNLNFSKHLRAIDKNIVGELKIVLNQLILAPFVKQLEIPEEANEVYDCFIFICDNNHFIIRLDDKSLKVFYSNNEPYFFSRLFDEHPNCDLPNPTAISVYENNNHMVISSLAYFKLMETLVKKKFLSPEKAATFLKAANQYQKSILDEVDIALQDTDYFKHVWSLYHTSLKMADRRFFFPERKITIEKIPDTNAIVLSCDTYKEIYVMNKHKQLLVMPIDNGGSCVCFKNKNNFDVYDFMDMVDDLFIDKTYPVGYFSSIINFNGPPYTITGINPNLFQAHQVMLYNTYTSLAQSSK